MFKTDEIDETVWVGWESLVLAVRISATMKHDSLHLRQVSMPAFLSLDVVQHQEMQESAVYIL